MMRLIPNLPDGDWWYVTDVIPLKGKRSMYICWERKGPYYVYHYATCCVRPSLYLLGFWIAYLRGVRRTAEQEKMEQRQRRERVKFEKARSLI